MDESLTSYCGLCCADCIPSREEFFALVNKLDEMLEELRFEHYAELKSEINEEFKEYPKFLSILHHMKGSPSSARPRSPTMRAIQSMAYSAQAATSIAAISQGRVYRTYHEAGWPRRSQGNSASCGTSSSNRSPAATGR